MQKQRVEKYSFPIYFVIKRVAHKLLCVQPHHQTRWPYESALQTTQAKPTGRKKGKIFFEGGEKSCREKFY